MAPAVLALLRHPVLKQQSKHQVTMHQGRQGGHGGDEGQNRALEALGFEEELLLVLRLSVPLEDD